MALVSKTFSQIITFSRTSGATWFNAAGNLVGVDFSVTSVTIGTGSKTFTLDATAGVNRSWATGDSVLISDQSNSANNMTGTVTSYTASTQVLVVNVTSTGGSGTIASWRVSSLMPRFDYDPSTLAAQGLLIEESRTNSCLQSEAFNTLANWSTNNSSITANAVNSPAATLTADQITEDSATAYHSVIQSGIAFTSGTAYTFSVFAKANSRSILQITPGTGAFSAGPYANFNLSTGAVSATGGGASATIQNCGGGWYRCTMTATADATVSALIFFVMQTSGTAVRLQNYLGDGASNLYLWGAQLEAGAFPTSYIPTTITALTRAADVASVNTLSPWYNAAEGAVYAEGSFIDVGAGTAGVVSSGASARYAYRSSSGILRAFDGTTITSTANSTSANSVFKVATGYTQNTSLSICLNAGTVATSGTLAASFTSGTSLVLGNVAAANPMNGYLRRITYYPRRLSNAELQAITL